jgi:hypothetical protein
MSEVLITAAIYSAIANWCMPLAILDSPRVFTRSNAIMSVEACRLQIRTCLKTNHSLQACLDAQNLGK